MVAFDPDVDCGLRHPEYCRTGLDRDLERKPRRSGAWLRERRI
jgi:hypothetical protein